MPAMYNSNASNLVAEARTAAAKNLLAAAVYFQTQFMRRLGERTPETETKRINGRSRRVYVPPFSKPGEYPMKRTGFLQSSIRFEPTSVEQVKTDLKVRVGYSFNAKYGAILEFKLMRAGLRKTLTDLTPYLSKLASGTVIT